MSYQFPKGVDPRSVKAVLWIAAQPSPCQNPTCPGCEANTIHKYIKGYPDLAAMKRRDEYIDRTRHWPLVGWILIIAVVSFHLGTTNAFGWNLLPTSDHERSVDLICVGISGFIFGLIRLIDTKRRDWIKDNDDQLEALITGADTVGKQAAVNMAVEAIKAIAKPPATPPKSSFDFRRN